ncbi:MAG: T9SS type A sorting domain-containing protein [Crocinitomicaceae bacterium]|nr:T9SS type A sorting domain-containing protein [Crocinitomicaceae bacterium]
MTNKRSMNRLFTLVLSVCFYCAQGQGMLVVSGYTNYSISGFNVLVQNSALTSSRLPHTNQAINRLESNLTEISQMCISSVIMDSLKAVPIFMDWESSEGISQYHADLSWLIQSNYNQKKWKCIEICNVKNFVAATNLNQPYRIMNEMAHAYLDRVLHMENAALVNAFDNAITDDLYTNVQYYVGNGVYATQANALAMTSMDNFFAELTETYFGSNNYFPFTRADFALYDPVAYQMIESIWTSNIDATVSVNGMMLTSNETGTDATYEWVDCDNGNTIVEGATGNSFTATKSGNYAVIVTKGQCSETSECMEITAMDITDQYATGGLVAYPNPGDGLYTIALPQVPTNVTIRVMTLTGKTIYSNSNPGGSAFKVDITQQPEGIYILDVNSGTRSYQAKLIKS